MQGIEVEGEGAFVEEELEFEVGVVEAEAEYEVEEGVGGAATVGLISNVRLVRLKRNCGHVIVAICAGRTGSLVVEKRNKRAFKNNGLVTMYLISLFGYKDPLFELCSESFMRTRPHYDCCCKKRY